MDQMLFKTESGQQFVADPNDIEHAAFFARYNQDPENMQIHFLELLEENSNTAFTRFINGE
jgi:hypothetical protein